MHRFVVFVFLYCASASHLHSQTFEFVVPDVLDRPTQELLNSLQANEDLAASGLSIVPAPYSSFGDFGGILESVIAGDSIALMSISTLREIARRDDERVLDQLSAFELGLAFVDADTSYSRRKSLLGMGAQSAIEGLRLVALGDWVAQPSSLYISRQNEELSLEGLRVSSISRVVSEAVELNGAQITNVPYAEISQSLIAGSLDGSEFVYDPVLNEQFGLPTSGPVFDLQEGTLFNNIAPRGGYVVGSIAGLSRMTAAQQRILEDALLAASNAAQSIVLEQSAAQSTFAKNAAFQVVAPEEALQLSPYVEQLQLIFGLSDEAAQELASQELSLANQPLGTDQAQGLSGNGAGRETRLLFLTSRNLEPNDDVRVTFGNQQKDEPLRCGSVQYIRDASRRLGDPYENELELVGNALNEGVKTCAAQVAIMFEDKQPITLLIHGFNNDFGEALDWAVAVSEDLEISGHVVLWSWSSLGSLSGYTNDRNGVIHNKFYFETFFAELKRQIPQDVQADASISIVSHSMGGMATLDALDEIRRNQLFAVSNLVWVAPDVTHPLFSQAMLKNEVVANTWTLYANENDVALLISKQKGVEPPAGLGGSDRFMRTGLDTIDVSEHDRARCPLPLLYLKSCRNHTHAFDVEIVAEDLAKLLLSRATAIERGLERQNALNGAEYFLVPN